MTQERRKTYFFNMRKYHNHIKRSMYNKYSKPHDKLLELAVGKGGDLDKWVKNKISQVHGYDIDKASIKEAKNRVKKIKSIDPPKIKLHVKDLSEKILKGKNDVDIVSCMFAFHYFLRDKESFENIMTSINNNIKPGGVFMGTLFDGKSILNVLKNNSFELTKMTGEVVFDIKKKNKNTSFFGQTMSVFIGETVLDTPADEYIVDFEKLTEKLSSYGFVLLESKMFEDFYEDKFKLNTNSKTISFLNRNFVFKKIKN